MVQHPRLGWNSKHPARFSAQWGADDGFASGPTSWDGRQSDSASFDRRVPTHGRNEHRVERIGKKYQWLALHELVGRMADNLAFVKGLWDDETSSVCGYKSAWQVGLRDIDPSLLISPHASRRMERMGPDLVGAV